MKLLTKIILFSIVITVLLCTADGYFVFVSVKSIVEETAADFQLNNSKQLMSTINRMLYDKTQDIQLIAGSAPLKQFLRGSLDSKDTLDQRANEFLILTGPWYDLDVTNPQGDVVYSTDKKELGRTISEIAGDWEAYSQARSGKVYYSDLFVYDVFNKPTIIFAAPVKDREEIIGVVLGHLAWPAVNEILELSGYQNIYLYNQNGLMLASGNRSEVKDILIASDPLGTPSDSRASKSGIVSISKNNQAGDYLVSRAASGGYLSYGGNNWYLEIQTPVDEAFAKINRVSLTQYLALLLVVFIVLVVFIFFMYYWVVKPIRILTVGAKRILTGALVGVTGIKSKDEIGLLANTFNSMANFLSNSYTNLDRKVEEKTIQLGKSLKELESKNKILEDTKKSITNVLEDVEAEKKFSEALAQDLEKFRLAVAGASDHIIIADKEGIILFANQGVETITGFSAKEILGKKAGTEKLWGGLMPKDFYEKMWKTIKIEKKTFSGLIENKRKSGEKYFAQATITPILNKRGEVEYFVAIERDTTKEVQIDRAKTEFVSLASHQLRTPLSAINWYSEMLLAGDAGKLSKTQNQYLKEIYAGNQRMVDLVNALLNISRIDLGTFAVDPEPIDFCAVGESVLAELKPQIAAKKMAVESECQPGLPLVNADPKLIRIVFQNLLTNALKYTPEKGKIGLSVGKDAKNILIKVSDTGYGIPESSKSKIFTKLYRADNIREHETEGTGLGLYMVKAIVEESQGKVWFDSKENKGSIFYVTLPLAGMKKKEGAKELASIK